LYLCNSEGGTQDAGLPGTVQVKGCWLPRQHRKPQSSQSRPKRIGTVSSSPLKDIGRCAGSGRGKAEAVDLDLRRSESRHEPWAGASRMSAQVSQLWAIPTGRLGLVQVGGLPEGQSRPGCASGQEVVSAERGESRLHGAGGRPICPVLWLPSAGKQQIQLGARGSGCAFRRCRRCRRSAEPNLRCRAVVADGVRGVGPATWGWRAQRRYLCAPKFQTRRCIEDSARCATHLDTGPSTQTLKVYAWPAAPARGGRCTVSARPRREDT
jgi:hypothetical protein